MARHPGGTLPGPWEVEWRDRLRYWDSLPAGASLHEQPNVTHRMGAR